MSWTRGFGLGRGFLVGIVILVVGLLVLAATAVRLDRDVLARTSVITNVEDQSAGPIDLPSGRCTIWLEDMPSWPNVPYDIDIGLDLNDEYFWGDQPGDKRYRDIEGIRCFLVMMVSDIPAGEYLVEMELWDEPSDGARMSAALFVLSAPGDGELAAVIAGTIMMVSGAVVVALMKWPMRWVPPLAEGGSGDRSHEDAEHPGV